MIAVVISVLIYNKCNECLHLIYFDDEHRSKSDYYAAILVSASFFYDFVHQIYNCYGYISKTSYVEYTYIVPLALSGVFALLCCFYFGTVSLSLTGSNFDFKNFTLIHFVTIMWCFLKLLLIMQKLVDFKLDVDCLLEFLTLISLTVFFFCFISSIDKQGEIRKGFILFSILSLIFSFTLAAPRLLMIIIGKGNLLSNVDYSLITYIVIGAYARSLSNKALKRN